MQHTRMDTAEYHPGVYTLDITLKDVKDQIQYADVQKVRYGALRVKGKT